MRIFRKKAVKSLKRRGIRLRTRIGLRRQGFWPQTPALVSIQRISMHLIPPGLTFVSI